jgi:hypothetical protein
LIIPTTNIFNAAAQREMTRHAQKRIEYEFAEFSDPCYAWFIKEVNRLADDTLQVTLQDGRISTIRRSMDYLKAPVVYIDGVQQVTEYDFYPAVTSVRWLMMLLYITPERLASN